MCKLIRRSDDETVERVAWIQAGRPRRRRRRRRSLEYVDFFRAQRYGGRIALHIGHERHRQSAVFTTSSSRTRHIIAISVDFPQFFPQLWKTLGRDQTPIEPAGIRVPEKEADCSTVIGRSANIDGSFDVEGMA